MGEENQLHCSRNRILRKVKQFHLNLMAFHAYIAKGVLVSFGSNETFAVFDGVHKKIDDC